MKVLVFVDSSEGKLVKSASESVFYGSKLGGDVTALTYGNVADDELSALGQYGASEVLIHKGLDHMDPVKLSRLVAAAVDQTGAEAVVFSHDFTGKAVAPMAAAKMKSGLVTGAVDFPDTSNGFTVKSAVFSGKAFANYKINTDKKFISLLPNSINIEKGSGSANVNAFDADLGDSRIVVKEVKKQVSDSGPVLTEADLVVSAGRGLKGPENWGMVEELAKEIGAATACSRPVADIGWRPHHEHVGQTGIAIRPNLYIAIGISGAIQHLAGVNGSKVIVVINTDPEAPFFKAADYGIVGDAFEVVPKMIEAIKKLNAA